MQKATLRTRFRASLHLIIALLLPTNSYYAQQSSDPGFNASVERPAYSRKHPRVVIDEAHTNFHTAEGRYKPFADLLRSDGYEVVPGTRSFQKDTLKGVSVLVIANAGNSDAGGDTPDAAFTEQECDVVREWVRSGGSLLLIADHAPFGSAAANLAKRFGVEMGKGFVFDLANSDGNPTTLVFSRDNGLLGSHPLLRGRSPSEEVKRVVAFTGQSLGVPEGAVALMKLGPSAYEAPTRQQLQSALNIASRNTPDPKNELIASGASAVGGRAQSIAMKFGRGRLVVMGEAAMFSAQVGRFTQAGQQQEFKMGMNVPGNDDKQFALNVMHWLSGLLK